MTPPNDPGHSAPDPGAPIRLTRLVVGLVLLVGGVVVWLATDTSWIGGLISGVGVVVGYSAVSPAVERWRSR